MIWSWSTESHSASMPFSRMALPRRRAASIWASLCVRFTTARWLNITL